MFGVKSKIHKNSIVAEHSHTYTHIQLPLFAQKGAIEEFDSIYIL